MADRAQNDLNYARIIIVYPCSREFEWERRALLSDAIPDIQQFAFHVGVDMEFFSPIAIDDEWCAVEEILELLEHPETHIMFLLGNKYGNFMPPQKLTSSEYDRILASAKEIGANVENIKSCYTLTRSHDQTEYYRFRKSRLVNSKSAVALNEMLQNSIKHAFKARALDGDVWNEGEPFFISTIDYMVNKALRHPQKIIFLIREVNGIECSEENSSWIESDDEKRMKLETLKKLVEESSTKKFHFKLQPESTSMDVWPDSRSYDKYIEQFIQKVSDCLQTLVTLNVPPKVNIVETMEDIARAENESHLAFAESQLPLKWFERPQIDEKIEKWVWEKAPKKYIHITGENVCGKTAILCRLYSLLKNKKDSYAIIRFTNLTPGSIFAHEFWHTISVNLCHLSGRSTNDLLNSFYLATSLNEFALILENLDRPLFLLIDNVNLMKFGRCVNALNGPFKKLPSNLILITTSDSKDPISFMPLTDEFSIPSYQAIESSQFLRQYYSEFEKLIGVDQLNHITNKVKKSENLVKNLLYTSLILETGQNQISWNAFLEDIELEFGLNSVRLFSRLLSISPHGMTSLELRDAFLFARSEAIHHQPYLIHTLIRRFGIVITKLIRNRRIVYRWSHRFVTSAIRNRYFTSNVSFQTELRDAHSQLAELFADSPVQHASPSLIVSMSIYPQNLRRHNGTVNVGRISNLWFHLLHAENLVLLKEQALCNFDYIEAFIRSCGSIQLLSVLEECSMKFLHHDIQILFEQVILPSLNTVAHDNNLLAAEVIGRLGSTQEENSRFLNAIVEQAMSWVDMYNKRPLIVPLTCWIDPLWRKKALSFTPTNWINAQLILQPTHNQQHLLISGNGSVPGLIYLYHIASQLLVRTYAGHDSYVTSLSNIGNSEYFISTSLDGTVRIWNFKKVNAIDVLKPHTDKVTCSLATSDCKHIITGGSDSCVYMISLKTKEIVRSFKDNTGTIISIAVLSNDEFLVIGSGDFVVVIWNLNTNESVVRLCGLMAPVTCIAVTNNDGFVIVACEDETLRLFGTVSGQEIHQLFGHEGKVLAVVAAQDDCQLFASTISRIYAYDLHNGELLNILECDALECVSSIKITYDDYYLISACGNKIDVWNIFHPQYNTRCRRQRERKGIITTICMSKDEKNAAYGNVYGVIAMWKLDNCQCIWTVSHEERKPITCLKFATSCIYLISGNEEGQICIWEATTGSLLKEITISTYAIASLSYFMNDERILSTDKFPMTFIWIVQSTDEAVELFQILSIIEIWPPTIISPDGLHLIGYSSSTKNEMCVRALADASTSMTKISHTAEITCFDTTNIFSLLITGSADHSLKIWQIHTGFLTQVLVGHNDIVTCCDIGENERVVVSGSIDEHIIVWDVLTGEAMRSIRTKDIITALHLTIDSSVIIVATECGWIETYDVETSKGLSSFNAHRTVKSLISSVDGSRIVLLLQDCSQFPILCLHNSPVGTSDVSGIERRRSNGRAQGAISFSGISSEKKIQPLTSSLNQITGSSDGFKSPPRQKNTFDKIERARPKMSSEKVRSSNNTASSKITPSKVDAKSNVCALL